MTEIERNTKCIEKWRIYNSIKISIPNSKELAEPLLLPNNAESVFPLSSLAELKSETSRTFDPMIMSFSIGKSLPHDSSHRIWFLSLAMLSLNDIVKIILLWDCCGIDQNSRRKKANKLSTSILVTG